MIFNALLFYHKNIGFATFYIFHNIFIKARHRTPGSPKKVEKARVKGVRHREKPVIPLMRFIKTKAESPQQDEDSKFLKGFLLFIKQIKRANARIPADIIIAISKYFIKLTFLILLKDKPLYEKRHSVSLSVLVFLIKPKQPRY